MWVFILEDRVIFRPRTCVIAAGFVDADCAVLFRPFISVVIKSAFYEVLGCVERRAVLSLRSSTRISRYAVLRHAIPLILSHNALIAAFGVPRTPHIPSRTMFDAMSHHTFVRTRCFGSLSSAMFSPRGLTRGA